MIWETRLTYAYLDRAFDRDTASVAGAAAGSVTLTPKLKLLYGNNPGGYTVVTDVGRMQQAKVDAETGIFTFTELPRGRYELKFGLVGHPEQSAEVLLRDDQDSAVQDFD